MGRGSGEGEAIAGGLVRHVGGGMRGAGVARKWRPSGGHTAHSPQQLHFSIVMFPPPF